MAVSKRANKTIWNLKRTDFHKYVVLVRFGTDGKVQKLGYVIALENAIIGTNQWMRENWRLWRIQACIVELKSGQVIWSAGPLEYQWFVDEVPAHEYE